MLRRKTKKIETDRYKKMGGWADSPAAHFMLASKSAPPFVVGAADVAV
jgi:hypothetical protein